MRRYSPFAAVNMSSNTSPNGADVSAVDDQLASLQVSEGHANAKGSDTSADGSGAARPSENSERVLDPELWKPHPPTEDCPVCFVPLPLDQASFLVCCGKIICSACTIETVRAENAINIKRAKKKQPPLDHSCPFCRTALDESKFRFEERVRKGDAKAAYSLAFKYRDGDARKNIPKDKVKSLELLHHAADDLSSLNAMAELGHMYFYGKAGVTKDKVRGRKHLEDAVKMGNVHARYILGCIEDKEENIDLAILHWKVAAAAGEKHSMKVLWKCFSKGTLEKANLEETLRAHKEACDTMNSEERERYALWTKAEADEDDLLEKILISYYRGEIKAKELNIALEARFGYM